MVDCVAMMLIDGVTKELTVTCILLLVAVGTEAQEEFDVMMHQTESLFANTELE
jgi:hypothetical protein